MRYLLETQRMSRNKILFILILLAISFSAKAQERLLSKKIVYEVEILSPKIENAGAKDSIVYNFQVDRRFWWESIDLVLGKIKNDSLINRLKKSYFQYYNDSLNSKQIDLIFENEIRAIKFMEEWYYNQDNLLIEKKVLAFNPIIKRDSIIIIDLGNKDTEMKTTQGFRFELGWVYPKKSDLKLDTLCVVRNIQFTIPIYNKTPYHWWDSHLEPEYSFPYFTSFINSAQEGKIKVYSQPISSEPLTRLDIKKRRDYEVSTTLVLEDKNSNIIEKDTIIRTQYTVDNVTYLRFGEEWYFDKNTFSFSKNVNYISPMIEILGLDNELRGLMPIYYIRRKAGL